MGPFVVSLLVVFLEDALAQSFPVGKTPSDGVCVDCEVATYKVTSDSASCTTCPTTTGDMC